ncbi:lysozyme inhibitor LprI family protein [Burkholderia sp. MR1-5-21]
MSEGRARLRLYRRWRHAAVLLRRNIAMVTNKPARTLRRGGPFVECGHRRARMTDDPTKFRRHGVFECGQHALLDMHRDQPERGGTMTRTAGFLILMVLAVPVASAQQNADPIETQADACLATPAGQTTSGMTDCTHQAYVAYDKRMNEVYQRVMRNADPKSRELIRNAQRQWLAYRDAQRKADDGPWRADRGSMASPDIEALNVDAIRARINELNYYAPGP